MWGSRTARLLVLLSVLRVGVLRANLCLIDDDPNYLAVCQKAVDDAKAKGQCLQTVKVVNITGCVEKGDSYESLVSAVGAHYNQNAEVLILGRCEQETLDLVRMSGGWDFPVFSRSFLTPAFGNTSLFPNVIYMPDTAVTFFAQALSEVLQRVNHKDIVFVGPSLGIDDRAPLIEVMEDILRRLNVVKLANVIRIDENNWDYIYTTVKEVRTETKCIVIDTSFSKLSTILDALNIVELGTNGYLIVLLCRDAVTICSKDALSSYKASNFLILAPNYADAESVDAVSQWLPDVNFNEIYFSEMVAMYGMCYSYCYTTSQGQSSSRSGIFSALRSKVIPNGRMGSISFDANLNYVRDVELLQFNEDYSNYSRVALARAFPADCTALSCSAVSFDPPSFKLWEEQLNKVTPDCFYNGGCTNYTPLFIGIAGAVLGVALLGLAYAYQRRKRLDVFRMHWKIPKADLKVIENKQSKQKVVPGEKEDNSKTSTLVSKRRVVTAYALIGTAKAEFMVLKQLRKIKWTNPHIQAITELKRINHDNMTTFLGMVYNEGDKFYVLHTLVERASLDNFVGDGDFVLDTTFKSAFLRDIINGLQYLHKSTVGFHGMLNAANCLIDGNWVLKLSNFGLANVLNWAIEKEVIKLMEIIPFPAYYNTAPENLEGVAYGRMFPKGSRLGDIYSFGSLLYSMLFRKVPFDGYGKTPREIVEDVRTKAITPTIGDVLPEEKPLVDLMQECWTKDPDKRPSLKKLNQIIASVFESSKGNLIDQMIKMNYSYAQHLEKIVNERTAEFESQKQMNARLLQQILPSSIAEKLMAGETVVPRNYEAATVLFCQLVDFNYFLSHTAPHNVIRFLNDVFTRFDEVISRHDAYKVETTGETYMVASGVPNENDNRHVVEISEIALELRALCNHYVVEHIPNWKVQVRIGYHCGPIAAGVVGARAPRFCLFGDTVNFASRMQSNCPPNQIQLSEPTAERLRDIERYKLTKRGIVRVKGKGDVNTYWLDVDEEPEIPHSPHLSRQAESLVKPSQTPIPPLAIGEPPMRTPSPDARENTAASTAPDDPPQSKRALNDDVEPATARIEDSLKKDPMEPQWTSPTCNGQTPITQN